MMIQKPNTRGGWLIALAFFASSTASAMEAPEDDEAARFVMACMQPISCAHGEGFLTPPAADAQQMGEVLSTPLNRKRKAKSDQLPALRKSGARRKLFDGNFNAEEAQAPFNPQLHLHPFMRKLEASSQNLWRMKKEQAALESELAFLQCSLVNEVERGKYLLQYPTMHEIPSQPLRNPEVDFEPHGPRGRNTKRHQATDRG